MPQKRLTNAEKSIILDALEKVYIGASRYSCTAICAAWDYTADPSAYKKAWKLRQKYAAFYEQDHNKRWLSPDWDRESVRLTMLSLFLITEGVL